MKLLSSVPSPFAARVRLAINAYGLPVEVAPANMWQPDGTKAAEYLAINPMGKIPCLVLDDGTVIPESDTIVEYLADAFPAAPLRPKAPRDAAIARLLARIVDLYVVPQASGLVAHLNPAKRDAAAVERGLQELDKGLDWLEARLGDGPYAAGETITLADCALVPHLQFFVATVARAVSGRDVLTPYPKLAAYWARMKADPTAGALIAEMRQAFMETRMGAYVPD